MLRIYSMPRKKVLENEIPQLNLFTDKRCDNNIRNPKSADHGRRKGEERVNTFINTEISRESISIAGMYS